VRLKNRLPRPFTSVDRFEPAFGAGDDFPTARNAGNERIPWAKAVAAAMTTRKVSRLDLLARILLGAIAGWFTGKAADGERTGRGSSPRNNQLRDVTVGIIGALVGHGLFFWVVIGNSSFGNYATAVLGAIAVVGAARLLGARLERARRAAD
jgi:uncharacterized membrane protein YeaQ/YmgE (transglycosylase-associated protein family)